MLLLELLLLKVWVSFFLSVVINGVILDYLMLSHL